MCRLHGAMAAALLGGAASVLTCGASIRAAQPKVDKQDELVERTFGVAGLVDSTATAANLTDLCVALIEPASWEQAGGKGKIKVGRRTMTVTNTTAVGDRVLQLVAALGKLPPLDEKAAADPPKTPRVDVATVATKSVGASAAGTKPSSGKIGDTSEQPATKLVLYPVADLVWINDKLPPEFENLIYVIESCVATRAWAENGGEGGIAAFAPRGALVVRNTGDVLKEVDAALAAIRKLPKMSEAGKNPAVVETGLLGKRLGGKEDAEARLYHVADLALAGGRFANYNPIMQRLMDDAAAESWQRNGGGGRILKLPDRGGLAIVNAPEAHAAIEAELAKMRAEQATPPPESTPPKSTPPKSTPQRTTRRPATGQ